LSRFRAVRQWDARRTPVIFIPRETTNLYRVFVSSVMDSESTTNQNTNIYEYEF
jgi:adenine-specific DNA glycosylase